VNERERAGTRIGVWAYRRIGVWAWGVCGSHSKFEVRNSSSSSVVCYLLSAIAKGAHYPFTAPNESPRARYR
jgi:hypothetical protein